MTSPGPKQRVSGGTDSTSTDEPRSERNDNPERRVVAAKDPAATTAEDPVQSARVSEDSPPSLVGQARVPQSDQRSDLRAILETVGLVVAPATLLSALALYFGWVFTRARASYFGIDYSVLGLSTQDYLLRSTDAVFLPLIVLVIAVLLSFAIHASVLKWIGQARRLEPLRMIRWPLGLLGAALFLVGTARLFISFATHPLVPPLALGLGVTLTSYAVYLNDRLTRGTREVGRDRRVSSGMLTAVVVLIVLSLFWGTAVYAAALGRGFAQRLASSLSVLPGAVVYSEERLHVGGPGVLESPLPARGSAYRFRYSGLRLLIRSGGNYFLLPDDWSTGEGSVIVLSEDEPIRLEFTSGGE